MWNATWWFVYHHSTSLSFFQLFVFTPLYKVNWEQGNLLTTSQSIRTCHRPRDISIFAMSYHVPITCLSPVTTARVICKWETTRYFWPICKHDTVFFTVLFFFFSRQPWDNFQSVLTQPSSDSFISYCKDLCLQLLLVIDQVMFLHHECLCHDYLPPFHMFAIPVWHGW